MKPSEIFTAGAAIVLTMSGWEYQGMTQGLVAFNNAYPIYDVDDKTPLQGPAFLAQLYAAPVGVTPLQPVGAPVSFLTTDPGYFADPNESILAVPGVPPRNTASIQVVVWRASDGATFEAANHPGGHVGESAVINLLLGNDRMPGEFPADLSGVPSFSLQVVVPEPSVFALGLLGGSLLALGRRRHWARGAVKLTPALP